MNCIEKNDEFIKAKLSQDINSCLRRVTDRKINIEDELFIGILGSRDFKGLSSIPKNSPKRYQLAITMLEESVQISNTEKEKIIEIYRKHYH